MKKLLTIALLAAAPLSLSANAAMSPQLESTLVAVCKAGASNKIYKFNDTMKEYRINKNRIFPRLVCNGQSYHQFALDNGADKTAKRIARYVKGSVTIKDIAMTYGEDQIMAVNY
ncbi:MULTISPECIES: DUF3718 domain-containing protein [Shewanella]|uniref:DUF3718 domain-containing protein n=1 Tax=Shewanella TaxID=22 RepID=UPI00048C33F9|nr:MULTISPECIES: DUF3718 domain-containing protein [Shewanella]QLE84867.1 DUF3718 domain-containing protein [Shewanella sp. Scap07]